MVKPEVYHITHYSEINSMKPDVDIPVPKNGRFFCTEIDWQTKSIGSLLPNDPLHYLAQVPLITWSLHLSATIGLEFLINLKFIALSNIIAATFRLILSVLCMDMFWSSMTNSIGISFQFLTHNNPLMKFSGWKDRNLKYRQSLFGLQIRQFPPPNEGL